MCDDRLVMANPDIVLLSQAQVDRIPQRRGHLARRPKVASVLFDCPARRDPLRPPAFRVGCVGNLCRCPLRRGLLEHPLHHRGLTRAEHDRKPGRDHLALEFERSKDVEHEVVLRGAAEFGRGDDHQPDFALLEVLEQTDASEQTAGQTIQPVNDNLVELALPNEREQTVQGRAVQRGAGETFVVEPFLQEHPAEQMLGFNERAARLVLDIARGQLIFGCD